MNTMGTKRKRRNETEGGNMTTMQTIDNRQDSNKNTRDITELKE